MLAPFCSLPIVFIVVIDFAQGLSYILNITVKFSSQIGIKLGIERGFYNV